MYKFQRNKAYFLRYESLKTISSSQVASTEIGYFKYSLQLIVR